MQEKEATPVEEIETILPTTETNSNSLMEFMKESFKQMEKNNEGHIKEDINRNNETLKQDKEELK